MIERQWTFPAGARIDVVLPDGTHRYWSTHCRHAPLPRSEPKGSPDGHDACTAAELAPDVPRRPAQCKTCAAPCVCPCHEAG